MSDIYDDLIGRRVELISTDDPFTNLKAGDQGTVVYVDDFNVHVDWDSGEKLGLTKGKDQWRLLS